MKIRVGGSYEKVVNNTLHLLELKRELDAEKPEVFVQFVEMDVNRAEKEDFIEFWKKAGAGVKIRPKVSWAGQIEAPNLVMDEKDRWPCYWAMRTMSITDTGKVVTCAVDLDAKFVAGDVNHQSLREIWNGKLKKLRQLHQSRQFEALPENCKQCKDWQAARADYYWMNP
jgi:radical SAM protein with 4Fe4S-binding SPASM domain